MNFFRRLGLGLGEMKLMVPRLEYSFGESVEGEVWYRLSEPTPGRSLEVRLEAVREVEREDEKRRETVYERVARVGGEQEYSSGQGRFQLPLPQGPSDPSVRWRLEARLSFPFSVPLRDGLTLTVRPGAGRRAVTCGHCGRAGSPGDRFCGGCGIQLQ